MKKTHFPGTPFATTMARPGNDTEQRIRRIVRFPKMKRPPVLFLALAAMAALMCGNLAACQSGEEPSAPSNSGQSLDGPAAALPKNAPERSGGALTYVPLAVAEGRTVMVELYGSGARPDDPDWSRYYAVEELRVYEGGALLQIIRADELSYDGDYLFDGLFYNENGGEVGLPDHRDMNFDGSEDLGLLAAESYPQNVPYCYLLWDESAGRLSVEPLLLFAPVTLDGENKQLIEYEKDGPFGYTNNYRFSSDGELEKLNSEPAESAQPAQPAQEPRPLQPAPTARQAFRAELEQLYSERVYPGGGLAAGPEVVDMATLEFAVYDVDGDGGEELVIWNTETYVAARRLFVYGYDPASGQLFEKLEEFPAAEFYSNGVVFVETSHNQGKAGRFWPYFVYRYDAGTGRYEMVGFANALDREVLEAAELDLSSFPSDVDRDGDGLVYYLTEEAYGEADPVDGAEYEAWRNGWLSGASPLELPRQNLTPENIRAALPN